MTETFWLIVGFVGQALFTARFLVQWIASERARRSIVPYTFWLFSIGGGVVLLFYAIYRRDPVFIAGQAGGLLIYARNIIFVRRERGAAATSGEAGGT
jgi:lipid-A-disaccharide synthase-like uncharacterized protein